MLEDVLGVDLRARGVRQGQRAAQVEAQLAAAVEVEVHPARTGPPPGAQVEPHAARPVERAPGAPPLRGVHGGGAQLLDGAAELRAGRLRYQAPRPLQRGDRDRPPHFGAFVVIRSRRACAETAAGTFFDLAMIRRSRSSSVPTCLSATGSRAFGLVARPRRTW